MTFFLRFTNDWDDRWTEARGQQFFLVNIGMPWPSDKHPNRRMVERTARNRDEAKVFASVEECRETLTLCGRPRGWEIVDESGAVIE
jgi:hypothetical protein